MSWPRPVHPSFYLPPPKGHVGSSTTKTACHLAQGKNIPLLTRPAKLQLLVHLSKNFCHTLLLKNHTKTFWLLVFGFLFWFYYYYYYFYYLTEMKNI